MPKIKRHFSPGTYDLRRKRSRTGLGLYTYSPIRKGDCIVEYAGRPVDKEEQENNNSKYLFWTSRNTMIDGSIRSNIARYTNHSCAPNCEIDLWSKRVYLFAKRNIPAGTELTFDYDEEYFDIHIKPKGCRCTKCDPQPHAFARYK